MQIGIASKVFWVSQIEAYHDGRTFRKAVAGDEQRKCGCAF